MTLPHTRASTHWSETAWPLRTVLAGAVYFAAVFLLGWGVGVFREMVIAPRITSDLAIVVETPFMAWAAFYLARYSARWLYVPPSAAARLVMGSVALVLLLLAEDSLARALRDRSVFEQWGLYGYLAAAATFAGLAWVWIAPALAARDHGRGR